MALVGLERAAAHACAATRSVRSWLGMASCQRRGIGLGLHRPTLVRQTAKPDAAQGGRAGLVIPGAHPFVRTCFNGGVSTVAHGAPD